MAVAPLSGSAYFAEGLRLVTRPGMRRFVVIPLTINLLLYAAILTFAVRGFEGWLEQLMPSLPAWASFVEWLLWPLFVLLLLAIIFFTFTMLANLVAAPFNGFLAEKVEVMVRGQDDFPPFNLAELVTMVPRTLQRELRKLGYYLPRALGLLVLTLIPGLNLIAAPLWILFGVWMMAVQYIDFPADNHQLDFRSMLAWLRTPPPALPGLWRGDLPGAAGARPERPVHARRRGRGDAVLGA
ncbi:CysZ protein [Pseudomonas sp. SORGH_AS199]|nr:CysZ protein [Pseudomonas sp. SORGH_AS_0199]